MRCLLSAPELTSSRVANAAGGGGGSHPGSSRCHLSRRPPSYPPRRSQPSRPRLVRHDRRGTVSALGAELSPACRAGIALVVTRRGTLAVDTHDGPSWLARPLLRPRHVSDASRYAVVPPNLDPSWEARAIQN